MIEGQAVGQLGQKPADDERFLRLPLVAPGPGCLLGRVQGDTAEDLCRLADHPVAVVLRADQRPEVNEAMPGARLDPLPVN